MKKNTVLFLIAAVPLFPALSRFSAGLLLGVEFCLFFPVLLGIRKLLALCEIRRGFYLLTETVCLTLTASFYSGIIKWIFPVSALSLEFFFFAVPFVFLVFEMLAGFRPAAHHAPQNRENLFLLAAPALLLLISLVREILFFGIVSFPTVRTACFVSVLPPAALDFTRFFGSLPGSLVLTGLILWLVYCIGNRRSNALPKAGG